MTLTNTVCCSCDVKGELRLCQLPTSFQLDFDWPVHRVPLRATPRFLVYHLESSVLYLHLPYMLRDLFSLSLMQLVMYTQVSCSVIKHHYRIVIRAVLLFEYLDIRSRAKRSRAARQTLPNECRRWIRMWISRARYVWESYLFLLNTLNIPRRLYNLFSSIHELIFQLLWKSLNCIFKTIEHCRAYFVHWVYCHQWFNPYRCEIYLPGWRAIFSSTLLSYDIRTTS